MDGSVQADKSARQHGVPKAAPEVIGRLRKWQEGADRQNELPDPFEKRFDCELPVNKSPPTIGRSDSNCPKSVAIPYPVKIRRCSALQIVLFPEVHFALSRLMEQRLLKSPLVRLLTPCLSPLAMPNQPSPDRAMLSLRIPRALKARLEKKAKVTNMTLSDYVVWILTRETQDVELSPDDYRKIAKEIEEARSGRRTDHRLRPHRTSPST